MEKKLAHNDMHREKVFQERRNLPTIRSAALGWEEVFQWRRNLPTMTCRKRRNRTSWVDGNPQSKAAWMLSLSTGHMPGAFNRREESKLSIRLMTARMSYLERIERRWPLLTIDYWYLKTRSRPWIDKREEIKLSLRLVTTKSSYLEGSLPRWPLLTINHSYLKTRPRL